MLWKGPSHGNWLALGLLGPPQRGCHLPKRPPTCGLGSKAGSVLRADRGQGWAVEKGKAGPSCSTGSLCQILTQS